MSAPPPAGTAAPQAPGAGEEARERSGRLADAVQPRTLAAVVCGGLLVVLLSALSFLPVPYAVESPGPVHDTLGAIDGVPLIEVSGAPTYPTQGSLALTTVRVAGGPGRRVDLAQVVRGWLDPARAVLPEQVVFPAGTTEEGVEQRNAEEMTTSQENATAAALAALGTPVPTTLEVAGFSEGAPAAAQLRRGDVLTAVDGRPVADLGALRDALQAGPAGRTAAVGVVRDGQPLQVPVTTLAGADGAVLLGVLVDPAFDFPVDVTIQADRIGGPSAGMVFALGIVDLLTPGAMTGGAAIAGTGTIDSTGAVGRIGGIQQKMVGAERAGAAAFLAPRANCPDVVGSAPEGLQVVAVSTLEEARAAVEAIGRGEGQDLPGCTADAAAVS
ncbi:PDZ domain-containing protein [Quadrisphaera sp. DSM 44207]|uniref:YlbL family protein n=1 Tax=Quadrisphaera sp. DSM 44207 TaxID=1881057 RepID=UPI0008873ADF|nr:PDZ domain-containing protein [Quadrisphaera sp. DSM 44207]SDQ08146.1 PDZ domain-containing protein [Quadrisphaera sp. DSM 44207]